MSSRITPVLCIVLALALTLVYTRPAWGGPVAESRARIQSYDAALAAADRFAQKEAELTRARAAIPAESLARLEAFLPDGVDNVQLILDLDALAARSGVTLSDFDVTGTEPAQAADGSGALALESASPVDSVNLTLTATGSYPAFRRFMAGVEQSLRPLDIVSLKIDESESGIYEYAMTIRIYWLR